MIYPTVDGSGRLKRSAGRMAESIQGAEGEKGAKTMRPEGQVRRMGKRMSRTGGRGGSRADELLDAIPASPRAGGVPAGAPESFTDVVRRPGAAREGEIRRMGAEYGAKIEAMRREMGRMAKKGGAGRGPPAGSGDHTE